MVEDPCFSLLTASDGTKQPSILTSRHVESPVSLTWVFLESRRRKIQAGITNHNIPVPSWIVLVKRDSSVFSADCWAVILSRGPDTFASLMQSLRLPNVAAVIRTRFVILPPSDGHDVFSCTLFSELLS